MKEVNYMSTKKMIKDTFSLFFKSNTFQEGAALAYYTVFSILPMVIIIISIFGLIWGEKAVAGDIYLELRSIIGNDAALSFQNIIKSQHTQHNSLITTIIGFATLALSSSGMFNQLHGSFNRIWNIEAKPKSSLISYLSKHFISFSILIGLFFIIMVSISINSLLVKYSTDATTNFPITLFWEHMVSFLLVSLMFSLMFKFLGDAKIHWKVGLISGVFTSILFIFGKYAIGLYIGHSHISSTFGSASVLALLMVWIYYTSQIIFLGASFMYILGEKLGHPLLPTKDAIKILRNEVE